MTNPPKKESGAEHNGPKNPDNKEKLQILVQTLIDNLISDPFFAKLLSSYSKESLFNILLTNLDIVTNDELVCQDVVNRLRYNDLYAHRALLYLLIKFTPVELKSFLDYKLLRQVIIIILEKNDYLLINRLQQIYDNLVKLIDYEVFSQAELELLLNPNNSNELILNIIANSQPENLEFFVQKLSNQSLRELIYSWNFQDLLKRASPKNLELLEELIIDLLTKIVFNYEDQEPDEAVKYEDKEPDEAVFIVTMLLASESNHLNLKIFQELGSLTEEKLKACAKRNNFIYFISSANPFNLELLREYELLTEETWEFLEENSQNLMIYSNPDVLKLLLERGIIHSENLPVLFKDEVIGSVILQEGKPENFAALIQAGLINPNNFRQFLKKISDLGESVNILNILEDPKKNQFGYNPNNPEITIIEFLKPETYAKILSRLPPPKSSQN